MSIAIAKNHMAEMNMLGMLAVLDKTLTEATRDKISYSEFADILLQAEADYRQERKSRQIYCSPRVRRLRLHRETLDHEGGNQGDLYSRMAQRCTSTATHR